MENTSSYILILKNELSRRCDRNVNYSLRSFAKSLQIDPAALSRILAGKQIPSKKTLDKILNNGMLSASEEIELTASVATTQINRNLNRKNFFHCNHSKHDQVQAKHLDQFVSLDIDTFRVIGEWFHSAIMELTFVADFEANYKWIARRLNITETQAQLAVDRLIRLKLIAYNLQGDLVKTNKFINTKKHNQTTSALKNNQKQFLEKAIDSLADDPINERSVTSMTFAIDEEKLPEAKIIINEFNERISQFLETGKQSRVYNLSIALYPLQIKTKEKQ